MRNRTESDEERDTTPALPALEWVNSLVADPSLAYVFDMPLTEEGWVKMLEALAGIWEARKTTGREANESY